MIDVNGLIKDYGPTRAVAGISFTVNPGESRRALGPNGAGKSTTLRVLTGYLPPTSGRVKMGGVDVLENPMDVRRRVGYLSEANPLYESLGVLESLTLFARLRISRRTAWPPASVKRPNNAPFWTSCRRTWANSRKGIASARPGLGHPARSANFNFR